MDIVRLNDIGLHDKSSQMHSYRTRRHLLYGITPATRHKWTYPA